MIFSKNIEMSYQIERTRLKQATCFCWPKKNSNVCCAIRLDHMNDLILYRRDSYDSVPLHVLRYFEPGVKSKIINAIRSHKNKDSPCILLKEIVNVEDMYNIVFIPETLRSYSDLFERIVYRK